MSARGEPGSFQLRKTGGAAPSLPAGHGVLAVIAKAPRAGHSKTRLCPPCTPAQAATLAQAALTDTLVAVAATPCARRVLVLDGAPGAWVPPGVHVVAQAGGGLAQRLAAAFAGFDRPAFLVGMDTPQVTPELLAAGLGALDQHGAALGHAPDGGYWGIGLRVADPRVFGGVPMSAGNTGAAQERRLRSLGHSVALLPELRDVDRIADARAVAALAPNTRFAAAVAALSPGDANACRRCTRSFDPTAEAEAVVA